jgi:transposase-like protein
MGENNTKMRRSYTTADKKRMLQSFQSSGKTSKEWCRENQVGLSTLQRWQRTESQGKVASTVQTWAPVVAVAEPTPKSIIVIQSGTFSISVSADTDRKLLAEVLAAVKTVC